MRRTPLLYSECEARFSLWEKLFAERVFLPYQETRPRSFAYEEWLLKFAVSLAWRSALAGKEPVNLDVPECSPLAPSLVPLLEDAQEKWRRFLLGETSDSGPYQHHLFFMDIIASGQGVPEGFNVYILRSVDGDVARTSTQLAIYTKLPAILFWSAIEPPAPSGFNGTAVGQGGVISAPQEVTNPGFAYFLANRSNMASRLMESTSPGQRAVIDEWYKRNRDRVHRSETWKAQLADVFWSKVRHEE